MGSPPFLSVSCISTLSNTVLHSSHGIFSKGRSYFNSNACFGYGLKEGLWFWKRTPLAWDSIKKMEALPDDEKPLSPELI
ncbi:MAG: hypothetical protein WCO89_12345, partial [Syntrophus sp. (in: bacteria)]